MFLLAVVALVLQVPAVVDDGSRGPGNAQADARRRCGAIAGAPTNHDGAGAAVSDRDGGPAAGGVKRGHSPLRVRAVDFDDSDALAGLPSAAAEMDRRSALVVPELRRSAY
jgi:hypothetical protein